MICQICKKRYDDSYWFLYHLTKGYNEGTHCSHQEYYDRFMAIDGNDVYCIRKGCDNLCKLIDAISGYEDYCSKECEQKDKRV